MPEPGVSDRNVNRPTTDRERPRRKSRSRLQIPGEYAEFRLRDGRNPGEVMGPHYFGPESERAAMTMELEDWFADHLGALVGAHQRLRATGEVPCPMKNTGGAVGRGASEVVEFGGVGPFIKDQVKTETIRRIIDKLR